MHTPYENVTTANGFGAAELSHFRVDAEERREIQEALVKRGMFGGGGGGGGEKQGDSRKKKEVERGWLRRGRGAGG